CRSSGLEEVDIAVAVDIGQIGAVSARDCQRERIVESEIVLHAAGNDSFCSFRKMPGLHAPFLEILEHLLHVFPANGTDGLLHKSGKAGVDLVRIGPGGNSVCKFGSVVAHHGRVCICGVHSTDSIFNESANSMRTSALLPWLSGLVQRSIAS